MDDRFLLVTLGTLEGRTFPIVDTADRYHRVKCYATSWAEGEHLVEFLNRGSHDADYWDQLRRDIDAEVAARGEGS